MTYVSLYRKWRPQTFAEVVGQDHVVGTLVNAIQTGQVHHALLFTGTRGTGKTSTARILAKALNCERGPTPEPCNVCDACRTITDGTSLDVVEIDAASHGSVDDARDLREKANYAPAASRFKVYIVDEAHMVTPQGFNAMLKVLEEPPAHVRFVFCTTEPHKVIEAIRSRCQRHDFRRVRTAVLAEYFAKICAAEGVEIEPAAIEMVARAADGSVRDGQSRLDQVITFSRGRVTLSSVTQALGLLPAEVRFELAEAIAGQRVPDVFACVQRVVDAGHDLQQFAREALEHLRDLYVTRIAPEETSLDAEALLARIERLERRLSIAPADPGAPAAPEPGPAPAPPRAKPPASGGSPPVGSPPAKAPAAGSPSAAGSPADGMVAAGEAPAAKAKAPSGKGRKAQPAPEPAVAAEDDWAAPAPAPAEPVDLALVARSWGEVMQRVQRASRVTATFLEHGRLAGLENRQVLLEFSPDDRFHAEALAKNGRDKHVEAALEAVIGGGLGLRVVVGDSVPAGEPADAAEPDVQNT